MNLNMNARHDAVREIIVQNQRTAIKIAKAIMIVCIPLVAVMATAPKTSFAKETKVSAIPATTIMNAAHGFVSNINASQRHRTTGRNKSSITL